jgi:hypothetical protein
MPVWMLFSCGICGSDISEHVKVFEIATAQLWSGNGKPVVLE